MTQTKFKTKKAIESYLNENNFEYRFTTNKGSRVYENVFGRMVVTNPREKIVYGTHNTDQRIYNM